MIEQFSYLRQRVVDGIVERAQELETFRVAQSMGAPITDEFLAEQEAYMRGMARVIIMMDEEGNASND